MRFTWTSIGERKMLICCQAPVGAAPAVAGPATSTRPSAGDRTRSLSPGGVRWGSRKKNAKNAARATSGRAIPRPTAAADASARSKAPPMNGHPALSRCNLSDRLPVAALDVFHPVFELQFAFLEGDFFDLFGLGKVGLRD